MQDIFGQIYSDREMEFLFSMYIRDITYRIRYYLTKFSLTLNFAMQCSVALIQLYLICELSNYTLTSNIVRNF